MTSLTVFTSNRWSNSNSSQALTFIGGCSDLQDASDPISESLQQLK